MEAGISRAVFLAKLVAAAAAGARGLTVQQSLPDPVSDKSGGTHPLGANVEEVVSCVAQEAAGPRPVQSVTGGTGRGGAGVEVDFGPIALLVAEREEVAARATAAAGLPVTVVDPVPGQRWRFPAWAFSVPIEVSPEERRWFCGSPRLFEAGERGVLRD